MKNKYKYIKPWEDKGYKLDAKHGGGFVTCLQDGHTTDGLLDNSEDLIKKLEYVEDYRELLLAAKVKNNGQVLDNFGAREIIEKELKKIQNLKVERYSEKYWEIVGALSDMLADSVQNNKDSFSAETTWMNIPHDI